MYGNNSNIGKNISKNSLHSYLSRNESFNGINFRGYLPRGDRTDHISRLFIFADKLPLKH